MTKLEKKLLNSAVALAGVITPILYNSVSWVVTSVVDLRGRVTLLELYTPVPKHSLITERTPSVHAGMGLGQIHLIKGAPNENDSKK